MSRRTLAFVAFALVLAAGCARLGFWQLGRLGERRARNAELAQRLNAAPLPWQDVTRDSSAGRFRRVRLTGRYDYARELVLTSRMRSGAPGVHLLTPLVREGAPTVMVNRGWVYAADGMRVDLTRWHETDSAHVDGFVDAFVRAPGPVATSSAPRGIRHLDRDSIEARLGEPVLPFVVVQQLGSASLDTVAHPVRVAPPSLSEGSHRSYALQWFAFAGIAIVGSIVVARRS